MLGIENTMATPRFFDQFLDEEYHDRLMAPRIRKHCPLAQFLKARGYTGVDVTLDTIGYDLGEEWAEIECPWWAREFQERAMDCRNEATHGEPWDLDRFDYSSVYGYEFRSRISVATCRRVLEEVMEEIVDIRQLMDYA